MIFQQLKDLYLPLLLYPAVVVYRFYAIFEFFDRKFGKIFKLGLLCF